MKLAPQKIEEKTIQNFFEDLKFRLVIYDDARAQTDMYLASRFNVFDYLEPNENLLSDMIADLLDPKGKHGQKDAFLQVFLKQVRKEEFLSSFVSVNREFSTTNGRRIDVLLNFGNFGIGIENKPFAPEQVDQVGDYVSFLDETYKGNFLMIYLSHDGLKPKSIDVKTREEFENNGKFVVWSFRTHLIAFIEASIKRLVATVKR